MNRRCTAGVRSSPLFFSDSVQTPDCFMDTLTVPVENSTLGALAEIRQVTVAGDEDISAVNTLLNDGWRLLHVGHTSQQTVYVLGKSSQASKRRTGFVS